MDTKGYDAGTDGLHRDEGARRELEGDSQGEPAGNEDDEKHTAHSTLQSSSETILEEAQELSNFVERAFPREAQGQDPIAAPQSNDDANEAFQAYQVPYAVQEPDEDDQWGRPTWHKTTKSKKSAVENIDAPLPANEDKMVK
jgi:hypothetical protein